eukprot:TRINITY_DN2104_c0_g1_i9.p1 TRINITY_DN2104_c0_g1~~TRINITY_DN2104_c0_g1_i9.p1  ORF type:complete len:297 (-),score=50.96 TRINITY_DN2104_c0_g1_i9:97-987(-)
MEVVKMCASHWQRYPETNFFHLWVESKLGNPASILPEVEEPLSSPRRHLPPESEIRVQVMAYISVKTFDDFLNDPSAFRAFKGYLGQSSVSPEYLESFQFCVEVECFKEKPTLNLARSLYQRYLQSETPCGSCNKMLPQAIAETALSDLSDPHVNDYMFNAAQAHLKNKLKKKAFDMDFFKSSHFTAYIDNLTSSEMAYLEDMVVNSGRNVQSLYESGKPGSLGLEQAGLMSITKNMLHMQYKVEFQTKSKLQAYVGYLLNKYSSNLETISLDEFQVLCHKMLLDPQIPYSQITFL